MRDTEAEMSEQRHHWSGQSVAGRYLLGDYLGGTDHSAVFRSEMVHARPQKVAIKLIPAKGIEIDRQLRRWRAISAISHPHLLKIHDYGKCDLDGVEHLYVVMEYADEDLADILPERALNVEETRGMMEPVIQTLLFLHEQNLVHTHVHPGNILAIGDQIKLASDAISPKGEAIGLPASAEGFTPPGWNGSAADPADDVWSFGATVVAAMTQKAPSSAGNGEVDRSGIVPEPFLGIASESLKKDAAERITVAGIRAKLDPARASFVPAEKGRAE